MRVTKLLLITLLAALAGSMAAAGAPRAGDETHGPQPAPTSCPTADVSCPSEPVRPGAPITFTASVSGGDPSVTPTFNWTVSAGTISSGQGTSSITVNTPRTHGWITAAVEVVGYDRSCSVAASCSLISHPPRALKIDEYGDIQIGDEKARLANYAIELQRDPTTRGHLICYAGRRSRALTARRRCQRAANYLGSGFLGIDDSRIVTVEGGRRESLTVELWFVPEGAEPPRAAPAAEPRKGRPAAAKLGSHTSGGRR